MSLSIALDIFIAVGVFIAAIQLWLTRKQSITSFEDAVSSEYRQIVKRIPVKALLGEELIGDEYKHALDGLFSYIDFSNEEVFLRKQGRVRKTTWQSWCEGIEVNLKLPAFNKAWLEIKEKLPTNYSELKKLENDNYKSDPKKW